MVIRIALESVTLQKYFPLLLENSSEDNIVAKFFLYLNNRPAGGPVGPWKEVPQALLPVHPRHPIDCVLVAGKHNIQGGKIHGGEILNLIGERNVLSPLFRRQLHVILHSERRKLLKQVCTSWNIRDRKCCYILDKIQHTNDRQWFPTDWSYHQLHQQSLCPAIT